MRRKNLIAPIVLFLLAAAAGAHAQSVLDEHRFEIGGQYTAIGLEDFDVVNGVGGRFGYNFNKYLALDAEANFFPETHLGNEQSGAKAQGFVGLKAGAREVCRAVRQGAPRRDVNRRNHFGLRLQPHVLRLGVSSEPR
jgi:hypothetical protein